MKFSALRTGALTVVLGGLLAACTVVVEDDTRPLPPRPGPICTQQYDPVCGERRGDRQTYGNSCIAQAEGARIVYGGECRRGGGGPISGGDRFCTREYAPVCATRRGRERTFGNECEADSAGYRVIYDGQCARG
jgi:hypothetical protein